MHKFCCCKDKTRDEGFEEDYEGLHYQDDEEIDALLEGDEEEEKNIFKCPVHPVHLLEDLRKFYDENGIRNYYQNMLGNILVRAETCRGTEYLFYVNWFEASTVRFYTESRRRWFDMFGEWTWDMVPVEDIKRYQERKEKEAAEASERMEIEDKEEEESKMMG